LTPFRRTYVYLAALLSGVTVLAGAVTLAHQAVAAWARRQAAYGTGWAFTPWLWVTLAALILWVVHWAFAARAANADAAERRSPARKGYLYLMQLAALGVCVLEGARLVGGGVARALRQPAETLTPWPEWPAAATAGLLIGLIVWGFHRRVALRDGDFGSELGRAAGWRRLYFYAATAIGAALIAFGAVQLIRGALALGGELALSGLPAADSWLTLMVSSLTALAIGIPLAVLAWHTGSQPAYLSPATEVHAPGRVAFLRLGAVASTSVALASLIYILRQLFLVIFGERMGQSQTLWSGPMTSALASAPVAVAMWLAFLGALQNDAARVRESEVAAAGRRAHFYFISALALIGFWYGLSQLLRAILPLGLDALSSTLDVDMLIPLGRLSLAAALVLVLAPAWWAHWWPQQVRARRFNEEGYSERASPLRRVYLYAFIVAGAALIALSLALIVYTLAGGQLPFAPQDEIVVPVTGALAAGLVAVVWWLVHLLTLRADRKMQSTWERIQSLAAAPAQAAPGVRSYRREELSALPVVAAAERAALRPVVVVDGGTGALGAGLVAALRTALPRAVIWPVGLNPGAQAAMSRALGHRTPFAPPPDALARASVVVGATDVLFTENGGSALEAGLAEALAAGKARVLLLPPRGGSLRWVAAPDWPDERWIQYVVAEATDILNRPA
jgi:hypothetical protein